MNPTLLPAGPPASFAAQERHCSGNRRVIRCLNSFLFNGETSALFTAPLQPPCLIIPRLSRGVHHSASQTLLRRSPPLPRRRQKTAPALVVSGEAKAEGHPRHTEETNGRARTKPTGWSPPPWLCPISGSLVTQGVTTTLGTKYVLSMMEGHKASPVMDPASPALFFYALFPFQYKLLIKQFLCSSVLIPFHGTTAHTLGSVMGRNSTESMTTG